MRHKLLLADDSVTIQKVIELTFADEDIEVIAVSDGQQAIARAPIDRPDIVLADVGMPERDGYEVAAFIKETPELSHIPVLLLTGAFEPIDEGRARAVRCDGVLVKPFEPQMVINRVKELIAGRRPGTAGASSPAPLAAAVAAAPPRTGGTTDEYFDRLDAAFSVRETPAPAPFSPGPPAPHLVPPPARPAPERTVVSAAASASDSARPADSAVRPADGPAGTEAPTLAQAFAALLAAEQGKVPAPPPPSEQALRDDVIEEVTRRVVERLTDRVARDVVADVAERVVREEIDRIKARARVPRAAAGPDTMS